MKKLQTKFLVPILSIQLIALAALGFVGYHFSSDILSEQAERDFRRTIDLVATQIESTLDSRIREIETLLRDPIFIKFSVAPHYKSDVDVTVFNFQKGNGLLLGEPEVGGLVNFPIGLLANEGGRAIVDDGDFPSIEFISPEGDVRQHIYLGGSNDRDFEATGSEKLARKDEDWFQAALAGKTVVTPPRPTSLFLRTYDPISFQGREEQIEKELITIAMPLRVGETVRGVLRITTSADFLSDIVVDPGTHALLEILDRNDQIILRSGDDAIQPDLGLPQIRQLLERSGDDIIDHGRHLLMHRVLAASGWRVLMMGNRDHIYGSVYELRNNILIVIALSMGLMALGIFFTIHKLIAPILALTRASNRIAQGELGITIDKHADDEIGSLTDSFNQMSVATKEAHDRLSRIAFVRRQLLRIISHELRTPMNGVVGFYDLMQAEAIDETKTSEEFRECFDALGTSIEKVKNLVERLTRASSAIAGELRSDDEDADCADLGPIIHDMVQVLTPAAERRAITLRAGERIWATVRCKQEAVRILLEEALSNAIKYSPDGKAIDIDVDVQEASATIIVRDQGEGIPQTYITEVVEPFFEVKDASFHSTGRYTTGGGGLGLGLTVIASILRSFEGSLQIESEEGTGTTLFLTLPLMDGHQSEPTSVIPLVGSG